MVSVITQISGQFTNEVSDAVVPICIAQLHRDAGVPDAAMQNRLKPFHERAFSGPRKRCRCPKGGWFKPTFWGCIASLLFLGVMQPMQSMQFRAKCISLSPPAGPFAPFG
jgi:hypothetical protein